MVKKYLSFTPKISDQYWQAIKRLVRAEKERGTLARNLLRAADVFLRRGDLKVYGWENVADLAGMGEMEEAKRTVERIEATGLFGREVTDEMRKALGMSTFVGERIEPKGGNKKDEGYIYNRKKIEIRIPKKMEKEWDETMKKVGEEAEARGMRKIDANLRLVAILADRLWETADRKIGIAKERIEEVKNG